MFFRRSSLTFDDWTAVSEGRNFIEFDWIGIDSRGQFGIFSSVSKGYIPGKVFSSYEAYLVLDNFLLDRQPMTSAEVILKGSGSKDFWKDWAQKGFIAYDYYDIHRVDKFDRYDLIAIPGKALLAEEVPELDAFGEIIPRFNLAFTSDLLFRQLEETELR